MTLSFDEYKNILKSGIYRPFCRLEFLRSEDETVYDSIDRYIISGTLSISNNNGLRRSCNMVVYNEDNYFTPSPDGIWLRQKVQLYLGLKNTDGDDYILFPQGVFVISDPEIISEQSSKTANLRFLDKWALLNGDLGGEIDATYIIPLSTDINEAIISILALVNDTKSPILQSISEVTPYTITHDAGDTYADILIELANLYSREIYYNEVGNLVFSEPIDENTLGSEWDYTTDEVLYLGANRIFHFSKIYNRVSVTGDNINGNIATGLAENTDLISETNIYRLTPPRTKVITDDLISTDALAQTRAEYELEKYIKVQESMSLKSIPMYHLDVNKVITATDDSIGLEQDRYTILTIDLPLNGKSNMTLSVYKNKISDESSS